MKSADLLAWLNSPAPQDFAQGVALYSLAGGASPTYRRLFALPPTDYSRQVLVRELRAAVGRAVVGVLGSPPPAAPMSPTPMSVTGPPALPAPPVASPTPPPAQAPLNPELLADLKQQLRAVRDERSQLHAQLTARNLGKLARFALADRILALTDRETKLKADEAYVLAHGRLPGPVATADVTDAGELRQRLGNLLSRRSKLKKCPARAADLATVEADILLIREKLIPTPRV